MYIHILDTDKIDLTFDQIKIEHILYPFDKIELKNIYMLLIYRKLMKKIEQIKIN